MEKPKASNTTTRGMMKLPTPKATFPTKPKSENMLVLFWSPAFSAISALLEAAKAPSAIPSNVAAAISMTAFVVSAKSAIMLLAISARALAL